MTLHRLIIGFIALSTTFWCTQGFAQAVCGSATDRACIIADILKSAESVEEVNWRNQTMRDLAGSLTYDNKVDEAIALIPKITNPDTQAMTVRMIGMTAALYSRQTPEQLKDTFSKLDKAASAIQEPGKAIAHTYIAMAQAFAGLDDDAWATAGAMTNAALKHKAFGETAEIQAERGDVNAAMQSISKIEAASFRDKSYQGVATILTKAGRFDDALRAASAIDNPMKRAQSLQELLLAQEKATRGPRNDQAVEKQ